MHGQLGIFVVHSPKLNLLTMQSGLLKAKLSFQYSGYTLYRYLLMYLKVGIYYLKVDEHRNIEEQ